MTATSIERHVWAVSAASPIPTTRRSCRRTLCPARRARSYPGGSNENRTKTARLCRLFELRPYQLQGVIVGGRKAPNEYPMGHLPIREPEPFLTRFSESTEAGTDVLRAAYPPSFRIIVSDANRTGTRRVTCHAIPVRLGSRSSFLHTIRGSPGRKGGHEDGLFLTFLDVSGHQAGRNRA